MTAEMTSLNDVVRRVVAGILLLLLLAGCTSPAEKAQQFYRNGMTLLEEGKAAKAGIEFQNALQLDTGLSGAIYGLALVAEEQGQWRRMQVLLERVIEVSPTHWQAHLKRGQLLLAGGLEDEAVDASNTVMILAPEESAALIFKAAVSLHLGDVEDASEKASEALGRAPGDLEALIILARARLAVTQPRQALGFVNMALETSPDNVGLQLFKIQILESLGDVDSAQQTYQRLARNQQQPSIQVSYSHFLARHGRPDEAKALLRNLVERDSENLDAKLELVRFINTTEGFGPAEDELQGFVQSQPAENRLIFALIDLHLFHNKRSEANGLLRKIAMQEEDLPARLEAQRRLATALFTAGERAQSAAFIEKILEAEPADEQGLFLRASMAIENRQLDAAISDLRILLRNTPDSPRALLALAEAYKLQGATELADRQYRRAIQASADAPFYALAYADFLGRQGFLEQAERILMHALEGEPDHRAVLNALVHLRIERKNLAGAQEAHRQLVAVANAVSALHQGHRDTPSTPDNSGPVSHQDIGTNLIAVGPFSDAYTVAYPDVEGMQTDELHALKALTDAYVRAGQGTAALAHLDQLLRTFPDHATALLLRGQVKQAQGEKASAIADFRAAISQNPANPEAYLQLAGLYLREARHEDALGAVVEGRENASDTAKLALAYAQIQDAAGQADEAIATYEALLAQQPGSAVIANNLASLLSEHRSDESSLKRALDLAQRFKESEIPEFRDTLAWSHYRLGDYPEAIRLLKSAIEQKPDEPIFHYHLGMSYLGQGNRAAARLELESALSLAESKPFRQSDKAELAFQQVAVVRSGD